MKTSGITATLLIAIATCAAAQMPPPPDIIAVTIDRDHDHKLTAREIRKAGESLLKLDEDEDGALSEEELRPEPPEGRRRKKDEDAMDLPPPPPSRLMTAIDSDEDGALSKEELEKAETSLLELDLNDDGKIDNGEAPSLGAPGQGPPPGAGPRRSPPASFRPAPPQVRFAPKQMDRVRLHLGAPFYHLTGFETGSFDFSPMRVDSQWPCCVPISFPCSPWHLRRWRAAPVLRWRLRGRVSPHERT